MKYEVEIIQVVKHVREVEATSVEELKAKVKQQGQFVGKAVYTSTRFNDNCTVYDENGALVAIVPLT